MRGLGTRSTSVGGFRNKPRGERCPYRLNAEDSPRAYAALGPIRCSGRKGHRTGHVFASPQPKGLSGSGTPGGRTSKRPRR